jgi:hypothetical protein
MAGRVAAAGGRTWEPGRPSRLSGNNSRFFIRRLRSGNLLLVNHLTCGVRANLAAMLSKDDGETWLVSSLMLDERTGVSYPDGVEAADGLQGSAQRNNGKNRL